MAFWLVRRLDKVHPNETRRVVVRAKSAIGARRIAAKSTRGSQKEAIWRADRINASGSDVIILEDVWDVRVTNPKKSL